MISSKHEYRLSICATHNGATKCGEFAFQVGAKETRVVQIFLRQVSMSEERFEMIQNSNSKDVEWIKMLFKNILGNS